MFERFRFFRSNEKTENLEKDDNEEVTILKAALGHLRWHLLYPPKGKEFNRGVRFYVGFILVVGSASIFWWGSVLHLAHTLYLHLPVDHSEDLAFGSSILGCIYITSMFVVKIKHVSPLCKDLCDFRKFGKPPNFDERNKKQDFYTTFFFHYCSSGILLYGTASIFYKKTCERINAKKHLPDEPCGLFSTAWLPWITINKPPNSYIYFAVQVYGLMILMRSTATVSCAIMQCCDNIVLRLEHLSIKFRDAINTPMDRESKKAAIHHCIDYHQNIISLSKRLGPCFSDIMFLHLLVTGTTFGCLGHQMIVQPFPGVIAHFLGWIAAFFVVCFGGQILIDESTALSYHLFATKWYELDTDLQKEIMLVIIRSRRTLFLPAGPFGILSYELFIKIVRSAYMYLTVLNQTMQNTEPLF